MQQNFRNFTQKELCCIRPNNLTESIIIDYTVEN